MKLGRILFPVCFIFCLSTALGAAEVAFPYGRFSLKLPPLENPYPGFGGYFTTISLGQKTALWNPASLAKLKLSEFSWDTFIGAGHSSGTKTSRVDEPSGSIDWSGDPASTARINYGIYFREEAAIPANAPTEAVDINSRVDSQTSGSGLNFSAAQRVNDWLVVGFSTRNPIDADADIGGIFPATGKIFADLHGFRSDDLLVKSDGVLQYTFHSGGVITTMETTSPVWIGFLSQEVSVPVQNLIELRNNLKIDAPFVGTIAASHQKFHAGLNYIPISASGSINNDVRAVVPESATDQYLYVPNFDPNDPNAGGNWMVDPDLYGTSAGYSKKQITLPSGELVANAKYRGFYQGNTSRFDLGMMYDVNEWITVGLMLENLTGSKVTLQGSGLSAYYSYRQVNTAEAETLFQPGSSSNWSPISNNWFTSYEAGATKLMLEEEKTISLPKRLRYGVAFKRPFLIALDWEQNHSPITLKLSDNPQDVVISDLNFLHLGIESQLFSMPVIIRSGLTWLFKPSVSGLTADQQKGVNDAFSMLGGLPVKFDLGTTFNMWDYKVDGNCGISALSLINAMQFDSTSLNLGKTVFAGLAVARDPWTIAYQAEFDPLSTAAAYGVKTKDAGERKFEMSDVRLVQTIGLTYRF
ncbi:hypothetical protein A3K48_03040 [candidate division WOR-1 bacterium RIFOXYA12_FULL_52_29]|uniref:DUF5723 domain-containing protein n=1 Tax=candidate division WOR-1 bacterium RIFOXYC12_FULL_54_18 TaxID=1802584 RepID=A0A1F4T5Y6_UNCSA|nr:MAG: hypothetical protein A3K44_03040 [candidate division WOR-1 bacterium RIFOXYA2_FULL_51_19]OGC17543.1 MAG: hypothetical protein A3K48_03040 [candidate division WOR-1 bacterium RIFOXYA12_FULL_52_29]OGC26400.1 MAG: hypothetical protein A3K32_03035 [candidate division WOR-1 bacterium RIFOXYB2_FULL_45_9]OGC27960.1 MAG: hypothetical protein A3K49_03040 [candidate division WOR-1 bacterium RIFOXYC12_FULL_54_18]OGC29753.1 MAG: hypothetical protein A2346_03295 [candidate division WOR-1 bacterium R